MMLMTDRAEEHGLGWCLASHTPATTERLRVGARAFYDPTITLDAGPTAAERERERQLLKAFRKVSDQKSSGRSSLPRLPSPCPFARKVAQLGILASAARLTCRPSHHTN